MLKASLSFIRNFIFVALLMIAVFLLGQKLALSGYAFIKNESPKVVIDRSLPKNHEDLSFSLFWQVWDMVKAQYFDRDKINDQALVYGAIRGMVAAIGDPYTAFLDPKDFRMSKEDLSGNFEGVGVQIGFRGQQLAVIAPLPESPALEAGIMAGDFIIAIKDEAKGVDKNTVGITLPEAVELIRGPAGSVVTLVLTRNGTEVPIIVDLMRKAINIPSLTLNFVGPNRAIAHIRVSKFSTETSAEWNKVVLDLQAKQNLGGIILDLRNNPGGFLESAVDLSSDFLELEDVVVIEDRGNGETTDYKVERLPRLSKEKVVILVNQGSASSSEILAAALSEHKNYRLVGETSFGKGTIQEQEEITDGSGLHVTVARWLTPEGKWVNEQGLEPDVKIEDDPETVEDEQLQKALELLQEQVS